MYRLWKGNILLHFIMHSICKDLLQNSAKRMQFVLWIHLVSITEWIEWELNENWIIYLYICIDYLYICIIVYLYWHLYICILINSSNHRIIESSNHSLTPSLIHSYIDQAISKEEAEEIIDSLVLRGHLTKYSCPYSSTTASTTTTSSLYSVKSPKYAVYIYSRSTVVQLPGTMDYNMLMEGLRRICEQDHFMVSIRILPYFIVF